MCSPSCGRVTTSPPSYDSTQDTQDHIRVVQALIYRFCDALERRAHEHDRSKLDAPEKAIFDKYTPLLADTMYGSDTYKKYLAEMQEALAHHYAVNSHHPEHYADGISGMNLVDLVEMFCDWNAATRRHSTGDIRKSIEQNQERFGYSDDLKQIMLNTVDLFERDPLWAAT